MSLRFAPSYIILGLEIAIKIYISFDLSKHLPNEVAIKYAFILKLKLS